MAPSSTARRAARCDPLQRAIRIGASPILRTLAAGRRVLLAGLKSGQAHGLDPASGKQIWMTRVSAGNTLGGIEWRGAATQPFETVNGVAASSGSLDHGGATVAGGMLYVNSRYGRINGQPGKRIAGIRGRALKFTA